MVKIVEFENVYIELPDSYVKEDEEKAERVVPVSDPEIEIEPMEETQEEVVEEVSEEPIPEEPVEEVVEETTPTEPDEEEVPKETVETHDVPEESRIIIDLPVKDKILENALKDIEEAEKKEEKVEDPAVTKQATTKLSFEELQKRLEETQALHL